MTELLQELAQFVGIENIVFDAQGFCALQLEDKFIFMIRRDDERQRLVMAAEIVTPAALTSNLLIAALSFNFNKIAASGSWIALDRDRGTLFLADEFFISSTEPGAFTKRLEHFFQHYLSCQGVFMQEAVEALMEKEEQPSSMQPHQMA